MSLGIGYRIGERHVRYEHEHRIEELPMVTMGTDTLFTFSIDQNCQVDRKARRR